MKYDKNEKRPSKAKRFTSWASITMPIIRRAFPNLRAQDLIGVRPMAVVEGDFKIPIRRKFKESNENNNDERSECWWTNSGISEDAKHQPETDNAESD